MRYLVTLCTSFILLSACSNRSRPATDLTADPTFEKNLQEQLILADSGAVIELPAGVFSFSRSLSLDGIPKVTIRGQGPDQTVLSFSEQVQGAEGLLIKAADGIVLEGFTIQDTKGDALKIQDSDGVVLRRLHTTWTQGALPSNGGYGIYPVACTNVLIEECEASYASDAGIYLGQSSRAIVRNNLAHHNVAGIEIENSREVEVYGNIAENNTGGLLVFDLPDLPQASGYQVRVYENIIRDNNFKNFAPEGGMVTIIPPGTGIILLAHKEVEVFNNQILDHKTVGLGIISYYFTERPFASDNGFSPYYSQVYVYDNTFQRKKALPDLSKEFGKMINALFIGRPQDIVIDGIIAPDDEQALCLRNNGDELRFANLNAADATGLSDLRKSMTDDMSPFDCELPPLNLDLEL